MSTQAEVSSEPTGEVPDRGFLRDNGLSIVFGLLLLGSLAGQAVAGRLEYNFQARVSGLQEISLWRYLTSSSFSADLAENWQSEYLQFTLYIALTVWLVQRGSAESSKPGQEGRGSDEEQLLGAHAKDDSPAWAKVGGWRTGIFSHSLLLVMGAIFVASWLAQAVAGRVAYNEERMRDLVDPVTLAGYLLNPDFWSRTLQNWQSEMLAIASMAVFSIYLRERGSPESKKVGASHAETGGG